MCARGRVVEVVIRSPNTSTVPASAVSSPAMIEIDVDLPAPLGPSSP